jgi:hypothetical protein
MIVYNKIRWKSEFITLIANWDAEILFIQLSLFDENLKPKSLVESGLMTLLKRQLMTVKP